MDTKFLTTYNEISLENFIAVVKQNLIFQAQIKILSDENKLIPDLQKIREEFLSLNEKYKEISQEKEILQRKLNEKDSIILNSSKVDAEKFRIQTALNSKTKEFSILKEAFESLQTELNNQKESNKKLKEMIPLSKKKKIKEEVKEEVKEDPTTLKVVSSGGTF
jgi:predicted nuclease with TOPRIM domain